MTVCSQWITGEEVAECCDVEGSSDASIFDDAATIASDLLYTLSLRRFPGECGPVTVRPCRTGCGCPWQVLSRGHIVWNPYWLGYPLWGGWWCNGDACGCRPVSRVLLAGHVREITEVLIDGEVVDPDTYRVDQAKWLVRTNLTPDDPEINIWPGCQNMTLPEDQPGTFAVTYTYGRDTPVSGVKAAQELACNIYKQCVGQACQLPANTVRVARQGVIMEKPAFMGWGFERGGRSIPKGWNTGMPLVDVFLNAYNPSGIIRRPLFWSPTTRLRYAPTLGSPPAGS